MLPRPFRLKLLPKGCTFVWPAHPPPLPQDGQRLKHAPFKYTARLLFLLRASEYLPLGYQPSSRHMRGCDVHLRRGGRACSSEELCGTDEVIIHLRKAKRISTIRARLAIISGQWGSVPCGRRCAIFRARAGKVQGRSGGRPPVFRDAEKNPLPREAIQLLVRSPLLALPGSIGPLGGLPQLR